MPFGCQSFVGSRDAVINTNSLARARVVVVVEFSSSLFFMSLCSFLFLLLLGWSWVVLTCAPPQSGVMLKNSVVKDRSVLNHGCRACAHACSQHNLHQFCLHFVNLPFVVDDAYIMRGMKGCAQDVFFAPCVKPLILACETHKKVFARRRFYD